MTYINNVNEYLLLADLLYCTVMVIVYHSYLLPILVISMNTSTSDMILVNIILLHNVIYHYVNYITLTR